MALHDPPDMAKQVGLDWERDIRPAVKFLRSMKAAGFVDGVARHALRQHAGREAKREGHGLLDFRELGIARRRVDLRLDRDRLLAEQRPHPVEAVDADIRQGAASVRPGWLDSDGDTFPDDVENALNAFNPAFAEIMNQVLVG